MRIIIFLYLVSLYVRPQDWVPSLMGMPTNDILIPLGLVIGFMNYSQNPSEFQIPQIKLLVFYLVVIFLSTFISVDAGTAIEQFIIFLKRVLVFIMVVWLVNTKEKLISVVYMVFLMSIFLAYQAILQALTGESWGGLTSYPGYTEIRVRWYGDWDGPNVYGLLFVISAAMSIDLFARKTNSLGVKLFGMGLFGLFMYAIYFTNSRGAVLAVICALIFYFKSYFKLWKAVLLGVAVISAIVLVGPSRMSEVSSSESSAGERVWLWEQGLEMLVDNPLLGIGRGQFAEASELKLIAHNNYVQNFAELGLLGFFCFTAILWFSFKGNYYVSKQVEGLDGRIVAANGMLTAALIGYLATTFFVVMELDLLYFVLGLSAAAYLVARKESDKVPVISLSKKDLLIIISGMFGLIFMIWLAAVKEII